MLAELAAGVDGAREDVMMDAILRDVKYGLRVLLRNPSFTAIALLTLALGIGANTAIFSVINAVLWKPLPFKQPERLVQVNLTLPPSESRGERLMPFWAYPRFEVLRDQNRVFERVAAVRVQDFPLTGTDNPEQVETEMVSASYFDLLGVAAARGRTFAPDEDTAPGANPVALISQSLWQRRFNSDPFAIGQTLEINRVPLTVIGIMPVGFKGQSASAEVWAPMAMAPALTGIKNRLTFPSAFWHEVIGLLGPGATPQQTQSDLDRVAERINELFPARGRMPATGLRAVAFRESKVEPVIRSSLLTLFAAVGLVMLIACVNIANLLAARGMSRQREIAIRLAVGASRFDIIRQLLVESLLLALIGGVAALLVSVWGIELLTAFKPPSTPTFQATYLQVLELNGARLDGQAMVFNFAVAFLTGVVFGLLPALQASRADLTHGLKEGATVRTKRLGLVGRIGGRGGLVVAEVAMSLVVLAGAGLMIRSFAGLLQTPLGFQPARTIALKADLQKLSDQQEFLVRIRTLPGVESASLASSTPMSGSSSGTFLTVEGRPGETTGVDVHTCSPGYFDTLSIPLVRGRTFDENDRAGSPRVAIINETAARQLWPDEDPLGKRIQLALGWEPNDFAEIVGIVGDVKYGRVEEAIRADAYFSYLQGLDSPSYAIVRTAGVPDRIVDAVRREVHAIDRNVPLYEVKTMRERVAEATSRGRFGALLLGIFAALAVSLSAIGIYGVMSFAVSRRTHEFGIRMALGADRRNILGLAICDGVILTLLGVALGIAGALASTQALSSQLYGVGARDPITFAAVTVVLAAVSVLASYVPARRAAKVDPMIALRQE